MMKILVSILMLVLLPFIGMSQNFLSIPLGIPYQEYVDKLESKGFVLDRYRQYQHSKVMEGLVVDHKCTIYVSYNEYTGLVYEVKCSFGSSSVYNEISEILIKKYSSIYKIEKVERGIVIFGDNYLRLFKYDVWTELLYRNSKYWGVPKTNTNSDL